MTRVCHRSDRRMLIAMALTWRAASNLIALMALCMACAEPPADAQVGDGQREDLRRRLADEAAERLQHVERAPETEAPILGEVPQNIIAKLESDLAAMTHSDPAMIEIVRAESVVWSSGALGCPEPDQVYPQAQVPGFHVVLAIGEQRYDYRVIENGPFKLCE